MLVKLRRAVLFPQPAKDLSQRIGIGRFGCVRVVGALDGVVDLGDVRLGEALRSERTSFGDEALCRLAGAVVTLRPEITGAEQVGQRRPSAFGFGWAISRCCCSNWSAAREDVKDLRRRLPSRSRQSA